MQIAMDDGIGMAVVFASVKRRTQRIVTPQDAVPCRLEGLAIDFAVKRHGDLLDVYAGLIIVQRVEQETLLQG